MNKIYLVKIPQGIIPMYIHKDVKDSIDLELGHYKSEYDNAEFEICDKIYMKLGESIALLMSGKSVNYSDFNAYLGLITTVEFCRKKEFLIKEFPVPGMVSTIINIEKLTINELIVDYLLEKCKLINKYIKSESNYINKFDIKEVYSWPPPTCIKFLKEFTVLSDGLTCPWCIVNTDKFTLCNKCEYGKRHGRCMHDDPNTYGNILYQIRNINPANFSIYNIPGVITLNEEFEKNTKDF